MFYICMSHEVTEVMWLLFYDVSVKVQTGSPERTWDRKRLGSVSQSSGSAGFNMTVAHSCLRTRTLSRVLFQTFLSRRGSLASVQVRTHTVPQRYLTTLPSPGSWNTELSRLSHGDLYRLSVTEPDRFWGAAATDKLRWMEPFHRVRDCELSSGKIKWFVGGKLNVSGENLSWQ